MDIVSGAVPVGMILSAEGLMEYYGVSRSVVRESLRVLESMGMVQARQQVGTTVLEQSRWNLFHPQIVEWRGRGSEYMHQMEEVLEIRLGLEQVAVRLAAQRMPADEAAELVAAVDAMEAAADKEDRIAFVDADARFHALLLEGSGNTMMAQFASTVSAVLHTRELTERLPLNDSTASSLAMHRVIAVAIQVRDPEAAEAGIRALLERTLEEFHGAT